mgnify:CR=1 FL=1
MLRINYILALCLMVSHFVLSAQEDTLQTEEEIFIIVEKIAEFPGGNDALNAYFEDSLRYPEKLKNEKLSGQIVVSFMVDSMGKVGPVKVMKAMDDCLECTEEIVRLIDSMPTWNPAIQRGRPVGMRYLLPVKFHSGKYKRNEVNY